MVPRPKGEESEALNRAAFASVGQKRRAFEALCLSYSNGFFTRWPSQRVFAIAGENQRAPNPQALTLFMKFEIL
jgi:hypothetical protein